MKICKLLFVPSNTMDADEAKEKRHSYLKHNIKAPPTRTERELDDFSFITKHEQQPEYVWIPARFIAT